MFFRVQPSLANLSNVFWDATMGKNFSRTISDYCNTRCKRWSSTIFRPGLLRGPKYYCGRSGRIVCGETDRYILILICGDKRPGTDTSQKYGGCTPANYWDGPACLQSGQNNRYLDNFSVLESTGRARWVLICPAGTSCFTMDPVDFLQAWARCVKYWLQHNFTNYILWPKIYFLL